jgi:hypothetical protein
LGVLALGREVILPSLMPVATSLLVLLLLAGLFPLAAGSHVFECAWRGALVLVPLALLGWPVLRKSTGPALPATAAL